MKRMQSYLGGQRVSMQDLCNLTKHDMDKHLGFGPVFTRELFRIANGICDDPVEAKEISSTLSDSRKIPWHNQHPGIYINDDDLK